MVHLAVLLDRNTPTQSNAFSSDGADIVQQWGKFHLGAQSSGPLLHNDGETQGQSSRQSAVSTHKAESATPGEMSPIVN